MPPRKKPPAPMNRFLQEALEARQAKLLAMLDDVLDPVFETVVEHVACPRCMARAGGKNEKTLDIPVSIRRYRVADAVRVLKLMAEYGVSRPPEEKRIEVDLTKTVKDFAGMSDEELAAWIEAA